MPTSFTKDGLSNGCFCPLNGVKYRKLNGFNGAAIASGEAGLFFLKRSKLNAGFVLFSLANCAWADVQIVGLRDYAATPAENTSQFAAMGSSMRTRDTFCIVNTDGGAVSLTFTNANGSAGDGRSWLAKNQAGVDMPYLQYVANTDATGETIVSRSGGAEFVVTPDRIKLTSSACGTSNNVMKFAIPTNGQLPVFGGPYADVVSLTITPR